jgi:lysozyme family protein
MDHSNMINIPALENVNAHRWAVMTMQASRLIEFHSTAVRLCEPSAKARYQGVSNRLSFIAQTTPSLHAVPWWFIAIASEREYGGPPNWNKQLGQGDPLDQVSIHDPVGMGPYLVHPTDVTPGFDAWTRCCVDVLINSAPFAAKWTSWTIGGILTLFEEYNGLGYAMRGIPSSYVWSGTNQYISGKFVADHVFDPNVVDVQDGCAGILRMMMILDPTISAVGV